MEEQLFIRSEQHKYTDCKKKSEKGRRSFLISFEEAKELFHSPCHYCGLKYNDNYIKNGKLRLNNIKLFDHSKGYVLTNCYSCCHDCQFKLSKETNFMPSKKRVPVLQEL